MFTAEDKEFIRTILQNPAELTAWLVYADWLDEHNNPLHAEFLRLEVRRGQLRNTDPERYAIEERLTELRASLNRHWTAVFDRPEIENCEPAFQFQCPKKWENLKITRNPAVRHCTACEKDVHFCHSLPEAQEHARQGHCVAVRLDVLHYPGDLKPRQRDYSEEEFADQRLVMGDFDADFEPAPPRRPWWKFW